MNYYYYAYELRIQSELFFPELSPLPSPIEHCDVAIKWGIVDANGLANPVKQGLSFQVNATELWLSVANVARYLVREGREIIIEPMNGSDEDSIRLFLLGSCLGALFMQQKQMVLHGNVVQVGDGAVVFTGISGAGKSTLAGMFFKRGYSILADDVCVINTQMQCIPGIPRLKLWADTAKQLDIDTGDLCKIRPCIEKYVLPLGAQFATQPLPLKGIYILNTHNKADIQLTNLKGGAKYTPLRAQGYRPQFQKGIYKERELQLRYANLANKIVIAKVTRPNAGDTISALAHLVETDWQQRGMLHGQAAN